MSWTCPCSAIHSDNARFCSRCGHQSEYRTAQAPAPVGTGAAQPGKAPIGNGWKLGAIAGVLVLGGLFGSVVAVALFGGGGARGTAQTSSNPEAGSTFQQAFEASFRKSCRQSAMLKGSSQGMADTYCDCALSVFNETHSMMKAAARCNQQIGR
jgi:hypothetical protein